MNRVTWVFTGLALVAPVSSISAEVIILDNDDGSPGYVETGSWATSGSVGYDGGTYRYATAGGSSTATWSATLASTTQYEVAVWYVPGTNRATSTRYVVQTASGPQSVDIDQSGGGNWTSLGLFDFSAGPATVQLQAASSSGGSVVIADAVRFSEGGPPPPTPPELLLTETVSPGVVHTRWRIEGPTICDVVEFDLTSPEYHLEMGWAHQSRNYNTVGREPLTTMVSRYDSPGHDVVAAINCAFFDLGGPTDSIGGGTIATDGNLDGIPSLSGHNDVFATLESGDTWVRRPSPAGFGGYTADLLWESAATTPIGHLNYDNIDGEVIVYTPIWGASTLSTTQAVEVIVEDVNWPIRAEKTVEGTITQVRTGAQSVNSAIPADGLVIRGCPGAEAGVLANAVVGQTVAVRVDLGPSILNSTSVITHGAGHLVSDYAQVTGSGWTQYGFWDELHPRTVIASDGSRHWFVTFDGRNAPTTIGADFQMMSDFLRHTLGVRDAINLDGGGSTTLVINGALANVPSGAPVGTQRAIANAIMLVRESRTSSLPMSDDCPSSGRTLPFEDKFSTNPVVAFAPPAPGGDGYALEVLDPTGGYETVSLGGADDSDYTIEADVYCDLRPGVASDGFERAGIFARDDGNAAFDSANHGGGNCYALTFDSDTGRVQAMVIVDGVETDFMELYPLTLSSDGWHTFRIETVGKSIRYYLDGSILVDTQDTTHRRGRVGLAYHEYFSTNSNAQGGHFDNLLFEANGTVPCELTALRSE
ncbi:phosphodiester glycosidase family protein [Candidatus Sumerlaeota bacterium]|nr:phosphodiester glycosidase family protein [Candidatus Sumerlaeota bacterium]